MSFSPQGAVAEGGADRGFHEYGNNGNPYSKWQYGVEYPPGGWCMSAMSKWAYDAGFRFGTDATYDDKGFSYSESAEAWAKQQGLWRAKDHHFRPGDWVIFDWNGDGLTDHGEMVKRDDGAWIVTIGGNTGNAVAERVRDRTYLVGGVALSDSPQATPPITADLLEFLARLDKLKRRVADRPLELGDHGEDVQFYNELLVARGLRGRVADMSHFRAGTRDGTWLAKKIMRKRGLLKPNEKRGDRAGPAVVDWLTRPR